MHYAIFFLRLFSSSKTKEGFNANKLGQIQIAVTDEATKEPLQGNSLNNYHARLILNLTKMQRCLIVIEW